VESDAALLVDNSLDESIQNAGQLRLMKVQQAIDSKEQRGSADKVSEKQVHVTLSGMNTDRMNNQSDPSMTDIHASPEIRKPGTVFSEIK